MVDSINKTLSKQVHSSTYVGLSIALLAVLVMLVPSKFFESSPAMQHVEKEIHDNSERTTKANKKAATAKTEVDRLQDQVAKLSENQQSIIANQLMLIEGQQKNLEVTVEIEKKMPTAEFIELLRTDLTAIREIWIQLPPGGSLREAAIIFRDKKSDQKAPQ